MKRHWERIANVTNHSFDVENDNFQLRNIMEAPLLQNKEDIEVCLRELKDHSFSQYIKKD